MMLVSEKTVHRGYVSLCPRVNNYLLVIGDVKLLENRKGVIVLAKVGLTKFFVKTIICQKQKAAAGFGSSYLGSCLGKY